MSATRTPAAGTDDLITAKEAMRLCGCTHHTQLYRLVAAGFVRMITRPARPPRFSRADVERFAEEQARTA